VFAAVAAHTFGFDFLAYHEAANRILGGERLYDPTIRDINGQGLFYYPPPFVFAILPLAPLAGDVATWLWLGLSVAALLAGIALMPVGPTTRWLVLLLAGLSWPVAYALKLGQVGPILLFAFVSGWRWIDRPTILGAAGAFGAIVKIQPGLVLVWALVTGRLRAVVVGAVILAAAAIAATVVMGGPSIWTDLLSLLRNVSDPIRHPHSVTPGAVAFRLGLAADSAALLQLGSTIAVVGFALWSALRQQPVVSYLVVVVASQLVSPILWDHYAMLLLIPIAWLLDRGRWWAVLPALATSVLLLPFGLPDVIYPVAFWLVLLGLGLEGRLLVSSRVPAAA
jgi:alpha-1,2-mannosyltransferase